MTTTADAASGMSLRRLWLVHAAVLFIVAPSLACILLDSEYWPFSQYPMYSQMERPGPYATLELFGVDAADPSREVGLMASRYLEPFDWIRLRQALERLEWKPNRTEALSVALQDCLVRYDALRQARRHRGPALAGLRLYRFAWDELDPRRPETMDDRLAHRTLIAEVKRSAPEGHP